MVAPRQLLLCVLGVNLYPEELLSHTHFRGRHRHHCGSDDVTGLWWKQLKHQHCFEPGLSSGKTA